VTPPAGPTGPSGPLTEADKRYARKLHRESIAEAREQAKLCRRQYDEQMRETGEIGRDLLTDLVAAAHRFFMEVRPCFLDTELEDTIDEIRDLFGRVIEAEKPVWEMEDVTAKDFASRIDILDAMVVKAELLEGER